MGQTLSEPVTSKESAYCENKMFCVGSSCMQGWRAHMEDSHTHILSLPDDPGTSFFAVYDGHGGDNIAKYAGKHLHKFVTQRPEFKTNNIPDALKQAFLDIDEAMLNDEALREQMAGSTAVACLIKDNKLYCANAGDSRSIASINGRVEILSMDHKPNNAKELRRILDGGGWVELNRVNGNLALSRALGDFVYKRNTEKIPEEQIVTAYPDVEIREINADWEFVVLACDGIWDVLSNEFVLEFCRFRIAMGVQPEEICEDLMTKCLAPDGQLGGLGGDNMTVVLICFLHGKTYEDLAKRCASSMINSTTYPASSSSASSTTSSASSSPISPSPIKSATTPSSDHVEKTNFNNLIYSKNNLLQQYIDDKDDEFDIDDDGDDIHDDVNTAAADDDDDDDDDDNNEANNDKYVDALEDLKETDTATAIHKENLPEMFVNKTIIESETAMDGQKMQVDEIHSSSSSSAPLPTNASNDNLIKTSVQEQTIESGANDKKTNNIEELQTRTTPT